MSARSIIRGQPVSWDIAGEVWRWDDTGELAAGWGGEERPCPSCGLTADETGADPCMGWLPNIESACCGHGIGPGWIGFKNGVCLDVSVRASSVEAEGFEGESLEPSRKGATRPASSQDSQAAQA